MLPESLLVKNPLLLIHKPSCSPKKEESEKSEANQIENTTAGTFTEGEPNEPDSGNKNAEEVNTAYVFLSKGDSSFQITADMRMDHHFFGYAAPNLNSEKLILFSIFTDEVDNNPNNCRLGAYYDTNSLQKLTLKYCSPIGDFIKVIATRDKIKTELYFEKKSVIFN
uniref:hypothetical protein n=1 Tax=Fulvivirga sp. TaxID=1931237 RepID=UPI00404A8A1E